MQKEEMAYKVIGCALQVQANIQFIAKFCKFINSVNSDSDSCLNQNLRN